MVRPSSGVCGHLFCYECLIASLSVSAKTKNRPAVARTTCPLCKQEATRRQIKEDTTVSSVISAFKNIAAIISLPAVSTAIQVQAAMKKQGVDAGQIKQEQKKASVQFAELIQDTSKPDVAGSYKAREGGVNETLNSSGISLSGLDEAAICMTQVPAFSQLEYGFLMVSAAQRRKELKFRSLPESTQAIQGVNSPESNKSNSSPISPIALHSHAVSDALPTDASQHTSNDSIVIHLKSPSDACFLPKESGKLSIGKVSIASPTELHSPSNGMGHLSPNASGSAHSRQSPIALHDEGLIDFYGSLNPSGKDTNSQRSSVSSQSQVRHISDITLLESQMSEPIVASPAPPESRKRVRTPTSEEKADEANKPPTALSSGNSSAMYSNKNGNTTKFTPERASTTKSLNSSTRKSLRAAASSSSSMEGEDVLNSSQCSTLSRRPKETRLGLYKRKLFRYLQAPFNTLNSVPNEDAKFLNIDNAGPGIAYRWGFGTASMPNLPILDSNGKDIFAVLDISELGKSETAKAQQAVAICPGMDILPTKTHNNIGPLLTSRRKSASASAIEPTNILENGNSDLKVTCATHFLSQTQQVNVHPHSMAHEFLITAFWTNRRATIHPVIPHQNRVKIENLLNQDGLKDMKFTGQFTRRRTHRYLVSLMQGLYIVSPKWLEPCIAERFMVGETPYEAIADRQFSSLGPQLFGPGFHDDARWQNGIETLFLPSVSGSRKQKTLHLPPAISVTDRVRGIIRSRDLTQYLFAGITFILYGEWETPPKNMSRLEALEIISLGAGRVVDISLEDTPDEANPSMEELKSAMQSSAGNDAAASGKSAQLGEDTIRQSGLCTPMDPTVLNTYGQDAAEWHSLILHLVRRGEFSTHQNDESFTIPGFSLQKAPPLIVLCDDDTLQTIPAVTSLLETLHLEWKFTQSPIYVLTPEWLLDCASCYALLAPTQKDRHIHPSFIDFLSP